MICRLCLVDSEQYKTIFDLKEIELSIAPLVKKYLYLELTPNDAISIYVCNSCWLCLDNFHKFYCIIEEAQSKLSNKIYIKQEVESIDNDDNSRHNINTSFQENNIEKDPLENINEILDKIKHEEIEIYDDENSVNKNNERIQIDNEQVVDMKPKRRRPKKTLLESSFEVQDKEEPTKIESINYESLPGNQQSSNDNESETEDSYNSMEENENQGNIIAENAGELTAYAKKYNEMNDSIKKYMKIQCELCSIECPTFAKLMTHYRREHDCPGYIICCNKKFFNPSFLVDHINKHKNPNLIRCELCNKVYADKKSLRAHNITKHTPEEKKIHKCDVCPKSFPRKYILDAHKLNHMPKEERKYMCEPCGICFPSKNKLQTHTRMKHEKAYSKVCHICGEVLRNNTLLKKHQLDHAGVVVVEPRIQCQECGVWLKDRYNFKKHMQRHRAREEDLKNPKEYKCDFCSKILTTQDGLHSHVYYHHQLQPTHECSICKKSFKTPKRLKEHMTAHTKVPLYTCPYCPKTFNCNANVHSHKKRMHKKEWEALQKNKLKIRKLDENNYCLATKIEEKSSNGELDGEPKNATKNTSECNNET